MVMSTLSSTISSFAISSSSIWSFTNSAIDHLVLLSNSPLSLSPQSLHPLTILSICPVFFFFFIISSSNHLVPFSDYTHDALAMNNLNFNLIIHTAWIVQPQSHHKWAKYLYRRLMKVVQISFFSFSEKR